jgi:predicted AlkP superfamily phosphohydrolase/phosphomutase
MFRRDRPDVVDEWYVKLDALVGRVEKHLTDLGQGQTKILVVSDHGFTEFDHKVHLNRWLIERGYLVTTENGACGCLQDVDWVESRAYAVGLNSLYLNLEGREGQGSVNAQQVEPLVNRICNELSAWSGPDRRPVVQRVMRKENAFHGPLAGYGPDIVVGFAPGYRASAETGLGKWEKASVEPNHDHWGADHCVDSQAVPGVVFCSQGLADFDRPSYRDFPALAIGTTFGTGDAPPPPSFDKEEQEILEDRLKGLGYL